MPDSIDKLIDLLLDVETPVNPTNSEPASSPKEQQSLLTKPEKKPAFLAQKIPSTVESKDSVIEISHETAADNNNTEPNSTEPSLAESETNLAAIETPQPIEVVEESVAKVAEVVLDDRIQAISSAISSLKEQNIQETNNNGFSTDFVNPGIDDWILEKEARLNELADSLNNLIPLMMELLSVKVNDSQELILQTMIPLMDRAIQERSSQDLDKMSLAIARILPDAIAQEIKIEPKSMGKAIAPELALSIEEQIRLDQDAVSLALGSEMGKAIKAQIELEKDAMVDALYPVIGNTISKYLAEEIGRINQKVENSLSREGISRKIRAKMRGISEAELILQESIVCKVQAIFLIQKDSGLIICEVQPDKEHPLESDLVAGMLTAIRSFANDCIISGSELSEIDYGNFEILLEAAGYCYIAVVISGQPKPEFRDRIRETLSKLVMQYGDKIENYQGDTSTIPPSVKLVLKDLANIETDETSEANQKKSAPILLWLILIILASILLPWGIFKYHAVKSQRITEKVAVQLDNNPQLSVYRLQSQVDRKNITITGKVSSSHLRNLAQEIVSEIAQEEKLNLDNQIIAVDVPADPTFTTQEVTRVSQLLNQLTGVGIVSDYQDYRVTITGFILDTVSTETVTSYISNIPGVKQVVFNVKQELPTVDTRIYFDSQESEIKNSTEAGKIDFIKRFLEEYPTLNLRVIPHSDSKGSKSFNQKLTLERAKTVYQTAISQGVDPNRLEIVSEELFPPDVTPDQPLWLSRHVRFEPFIPEKTLP
ncbi:MAG: OmpA family protein [Xenococcaceae cyanobacterium MO_188.B19]|nr:OmpA family protein [Xenococcaceae cyanobacterium MO_188.B19]